MHKHFTAWTEINGRLRFLILAFVRPMAQTAAFSCFTWHDCRDTIPGLFCRDSHQNWGFFFINFLFHSVLKTFQDLHRLLLEEFCTKVHNIRMVQATWWRIFRRLFIQCIHMHDIPVLLYSSPPVCYACANPFVLVSLSSGILLLSKILGASDYMHLLICSFPYGENCIFFSKSKPDVIESKNVWFFCTWHCGESLTTTENKLMKAAAIKKKR